MVWARVWFGWPPGRYGHLRVRGPGPDHLVAPVGAVRPGPRARPVLLDSLFAPDGINLVDNTSSLLPALLLSPVTVLFGPVVSFNVAVTVAPALNAWCAYAAIRPVHRPAAPAFAGGLLYGFWPFVLTSSFVGHLQFAVLFFPPLLFLVLYEIAGRDGPGRTAGRP